MSRNGFKVGASPTLSRLKASANFEPVHKRIHLSDEILDVWVSPLTLAETDKARQSARRSSKEGNDESDWVLHLVTIKLLDANGNRLFVPEEIDALKRNLYIEDAQLLMAAALGNKAPEIEETDEDDSAASQDPKESQRNSEQTSKPA